MKSRIKKLNSGYAVEVSYYSNWEMVQLVKKHITAAQIKREIDEKRYKLPDFSNTLPVDNVQEQIKDSRSVHNAILKYLKEHTDSGITISVLNDELGIANSSKFTSIIYHMVRKGILERIIMLDSGRRYSYAVPGVLPQGDIESRIYDILFKHPTGMPLRTVLAHTGIVIPYNVQEIVENMVHTKKIQRKEMIRYDRQSRVTIYYV